MDFSSLPVNVAATLLKDQTYDLIIKTCSSSKEAKRNLCDQDLFWQYLYGAKYPGEKVDKKGMTWKQLYFLREFGTRIFLSRVSWSLGNNIFLNPEENEEELIEDSKQIKNYLENYIIPWTVDANGEVWIEINEKENGEREYLKFRPEEYPTAYDFMMLLLAYFNEDSGLSEAEFIDQFKEVWFTEDKLRRKMEEDIETARLFAPRRRQRTGPAFIGTIDPPEVREQKLAAARAHDQEMLAERLEHIR